MVTEAFCMWSADRLLEELRSGSIPETLRPLDVAWDPMSRIFSSKLVEGDVDLARRFIASTGGLMWGALLSRQDLDDPEITDALVTALESVEDPERQIGLFHHLAGRTLDDEQHRAAADWLERNAEAFIDDQRQVFPGPAGAERLRGRLADPDKRFANKTWAYMYSVHALGSVEARELLEHYSTSENERVAKAAKASMSILSRE